MATCPNCGGRVLDIATHLPRCGERERATGASDVAVSTAAPPRATEHPPSMVQTPERRYFGNGVLVLAAVVAVIPPVAALLWSNNIMSDFRANEASAQSAPQQEVV